MASLRSYEPKTEKRGFEKDKVFFFFYLKKSPFEVERLEKTHFQHAESVQCSSGTSNLTISLNSSVRTVDYFKNLPDNTYCH